MILLKTGGSGMNMEKDKKLIKVDRLDCYIQRFRENIRLQEHLEKKRKSSILAKLFKRTV